MENKEFFEEIEYSLNRVRKDAYDEGYKACNKEHFDPYLFPNVNFSLQLKEDDERNEMFKEQRMERGFDETELWNLDTTILKFILPRLKEFKECSCGYPCDFNSQEEWHEALEKMINSIESIINDENANYEGWELFKKYFFGLWW